MTPPTGRIRTEVAAGGAVGAVLRAVAVNAAAAAGVGEAAVIVVVNLVGAAALGALIGLAERDGRWRRWLPLVGTGVLGGLTTFSTLAAIVAGSLDEGAFGTVANVVLVSLLGGFVAAVAGRSAVRARTGGGAP